MAMILNFTADPTILHDECVHELVVVWKIFIDATLYSENVEHY